MKKNTAIYASTFCIILIFITTAFTLEKNGGPKIYKFGESSHGNSTQKSSGGISGRTQSPKDILNNPNSCEECHGGGSSIPTITLTANPAFGPGNTYIPGTNYTITYTVSGYPNFGFDLEIDNGNTSTSTALGTLSKGTNTKISSLEVIHTSPIPTGSSATFNWTAPNNGTAYLYSTALGVNGTGSTSGDKQAFYNLVLTPEPLGIEETILNLNDIKLFPNPAKETATLNYYLNKDSQVTINISDLNGKIVTTQINEDASEGSYTKKLDLSDLKAGTYFVKIKSDDNSVTKKLVVQ
jgi:hypothetical protein